MSEVPIPPASLARLREAYGAFTQLVQVVAEAMNLDKIDGVDLPRGVLIVGSDAQAPNGVVKDEITA